MWLLVLVGVVGLLVGLRLWYRTWSGRCVSSASMRGKTVIVTGASAGIGLHTAADLVKRGARVILACRNLKKAGRVADELRKGASDGGEVVVRHLDTSDLASVRRFAQEILDTEKNIHVLVNNAGIYAPEERQVTGDGLEVTVATNHFGHFLLTNLLLDHLKQSSPSRIINVSSLGHRLTRSLDIDDLNLERESYSQVKAYVKSKLCNVLFTLELARRLQGTGVTANSLHPGAVDTDVLKREGKSFSTKLLKLCMSIISKDPALGAQTTIHLAVAEEVEGVSGKYFADCKEVHTSSLGRDQDLARKLWEASEKAVKLTSGEAR